MLLHALLAAVCVALTRRMGDVATVWLANAPVVALLLYRPGHWSLALPAVAVANALVNLLTGSPPAAAAAFACANTLTIGLALALLQRAGMAAATLRRTSHLWRLMIFGALLPDLVGASLGAALLAGFQGADFARAWTAWVQGALAGSVVVLPLAGLVCRGGWAAVGPELLEVRMLVFACLCVGVTLLCLAHLPYPFVMLAIPLLWAATSVGQLAHAVLVALVVLTANAAVATGVYLALPMQLHWEHMYMMLALIAACVPSQLLAAATAEQRDQRAELAERADALRRSNDGLEQFVRIASHDLREPLNTIMQFNQLVRDDAAAALAQPSRRYLELVAKAAKSMRDLLDDVLDYVRVQRLDTGEGQPVSLDALFDELRQTLAGSLRMTGAELEVAALPVVNGNASMLSLLFQNLLANAIKFVPTGVTPQVRISARVEGGEVLVTVADNGIGIAAADQARLFRPFSRLHLRRQYDGSGLGLALVRQIARSHGGEVSLESQPGQGSSFTVRLPAAR